MSTEQNKRIARQWRETLDQSQGTASVEEHVAPNSVWHFPGSPPLNFEQATGMLGMFYGAFPDLHHKYEDQIAEGDKVVLRVTFHGTHQNEFQGIPATGKEIALSAILIDRYQDGKVVEHWAVLDNMGLMQQLGAIPAPL